MIYTVTFNPAIDYVVHGEKIEMGSVNRLKHEEMYIGGKGINVSFILAELGIRSVALGFVAGFTGEAIERGVREKGIETDFIYLKSGFSRINVKIKSGLETELNGNGPDIGNEALEELFIKLDRLKDGDMIVLAGSIPSSLPTDTYEEILKRLSGRNIKAAVDASGDLLMNVIRYKPFLIKPNHHELSQMLGKKLKTRADIEESAAQLYAMGAQNVLVSMAGEGAVLLDEAGRFHICRACSGILKNSVGAGDSMVAGFIAGSLSSDYEYALMLGTAAGGATAFSEGLAKRESIY
ncbi:MAG: 1-phosphofructokinase, partial [Ruminococcus sp.]|nr:1-phosphofructokinase [Ruminococcus sp.]